jgi:hypothetical protein
LVPERALDLDEPLVLVHVRAERVQALAQLPAHRIQQVFHGATPFLLTTAEGFAGATASARRGERRPKALRNVDRELLARAARAPRRRW